MKKEFLRNTRMRDKNDKLEGVEEMFDYLAKPESVDKMIIASELGWPVLTLLGKELENEFDLSSNFPIVVDGDNKNATARQNVGRIIKIIMDGYGYTPIDGGLSKKARVPAISDTIFFSSAIYKKTHDGRYVISISTNVI